MKSQLILEATDVRPEMRIRSFTRFFPWLVSFAAVAGLMLLIVGIHRNSPRTLISFHGYLHAAVVERFLTSNYSVPPENPFFAGEPLPYYWFFHFLAAQVSRLFGWNVFSGLEAVTLAGAGFLGIASLLLGQRLFRRATTGLLIAFLVVAGTNPFGILLAGLKILIHGADRLKDDPNFLWNVVHPVYNMVRYNDSGGLYGPMINFFLNATSRPLALGSLMMSLLCLQWVLATPRILPLAALALTFAFTTAVSPIIGLATGGVLGSLLLMFAVVPFRLFNRPAVSNQRIRRSYLSALGAIGAGLILAAPSFLHLLTGASANQPRFYLFSTDGFKHLITLALSVGVLLVLAGIGYLKSSEENRGFFRLLALGGLVLLSADAAIQLPASNQSNFFHAAVILLAIPAAGSVIAAGRSFPSWKYPVHVTATAGIVLLFLPTTAAILAAYVERPPVPVNFDLLLPRRLPPDSALARLYDWAEESSESDAVFVLDPTHRVATNGNALEFPAMTNRTLLTELPGHYMAPYPDAVRRHDIAVQLTSGQAISRADKDYLTQLKRPIYIVVDEAAGNRGTLATMQQRYGAPVFRSGEIGVFRQ